MSEGVDDVGDMGDGCKIFGLRRPPREQEHSLVRREIEANILSFDS
jgi:hypothetical protein